MVKGVSRRVIVVQPDERDLFEQAIFLVRDYTVPRSRMVQEACRIADRYAGGRSARLRRRFSGVQLLCAFLLGAVLAGGVCALVPLLPA